jgi:hypothetical protein
MKLTLESTAVTIVHRGVQLRAWRGLDAEGAPVVAYVAFVQARSEDSEPLDRDPDLVPVEPDACLHAELAPLFDKVHAVETARASPRSEKWGVYCLDGPAAGTWCQHTEGHRIETDERTARSIMFLFRNRSAFTFPGGCLYEVRRLPTADEPCDIEVVRRG